MTKMRNVSPIAKVYFAIVLMAAIIAICVDAMLINSKHEHMLADLLLGMVTLPSSLSIGYLYQALPAFFNLPFTQVAWSTLCGLFQVWLLNLLTSTGRRSAD